MADDANPAPKPNFDFIMKQEPKPKRSFGSFTNLPKPAVLGGAAAILLILILLIGSIVNGGAKETDVYSVLSDASVISTTSEDADSILASPDVRSLAASTRESLNSQVQQIKSYMTSRKIKLNAKEIATQLDATDDSQLKTAQQNNNYDSAFATYLKSSLNNYQTDLKKTSLTASSGLKVVLNKAYLSNQVLLQDKLLQ